MALRNPRQQRETRERRTGRNQGGRIRRAAGATGRAAKGTASAAGGAAKKVGGRIRHPLGGSSSLPPGAQGTASQFTGADASPEARVQARANAQAARGGSSSGPRSGSGVRGPAPDVTVDRGGRGPSRFGRNPLTGSAASRAAGAVGRTGLRLAGSLFKLGPQAMLVPSALGADDTESGELAEAGTPISDKRAAELEAAGGINPMENVPTAEEVEAATTPGAEDPSDITWSDRNGRIRVQRDRPETVGREGTRIDSARADEPQAAQLQGEVMAPGLPGVPEDEQEVTRVTDGQGGVGVLRAPAGARQGGGTFSTMENAAAAAVPVDNAGVQQARLAAIERGEEVPGVGGGQSRRERLRREIRQTRGLDQSFSSMMQEGLRRRQAQDELDQIRAQDLQAQQNRAAMLREQLGRQPTQLELAEAQRESQQQQRENARARREEYRTMIDRMYDPETEQGRRQRNELEGVIQRSGWSRTPENLRMADDVMRIGDALNDAIENENQLQVADLFGGGPDNPLSNIEMPPISQLADFFGVAGQRPNKAKTIQDELARIVEMTHTRTDDDVIWDDRVVDVGGTEIEMRDIPQGIRALIDNIRARAGQDNLHNPDAERTD